MDEPWKQDAKWQKPDVNGSIYMKLSRKRKSRHTERKSDLDTQKANQSASGANVGTGIKH